MKQSRWCSWAVSAGLLSGLPLLSSVSANADTASVGAMDVAPLSNAQPSNAQLAQIESLSLEFSPPPLPDRGRPRGRSSGGASRGSCDTTGQSPLTALVPVTSVVSEGLASEDLAFEATTEVPAYESVFSFTSKANPTFWFYVPYALNETPVEFVLQDEQNDTLYQRRLTGDANDSGVVSVSLPETAPALEEGTMYHWYFMAYCDEDNPAFVEGWTERIAMEPSLTAALAGAAPREQAALYAQNGIWQEAITLLGEQYFATGGNDQSLDDWSRLLGSVELDAIAQQPLLLDPFLESLAE